MSGPLEQAALLALVSNSTQPWHQLASLVQETGSALQLARGDRSSLDSRTADNPILPEVSEREIMRYAKQIQGWTNSGLRLLTVLDADFPLNLREVYNQPPFLFVRGQLLAQDDRAVAVAGTRSASADGLRQAHQLSADLARAGVTVISGLAAGIDSAAHTAALDAGGRTVAVFGTGINRIYPPANQELAERILSSGAHVSQFWPDAPPTRATFPMRNVVLSGLALGTVVVEARERSGGSMQARLCREHGKRLFLLRSLVNREPWARRYARRPGTLVIDDAKDVLEAIKEVLDPPGQLSFC